MNRLDNLPLRTKLWVVTIINLTLLCASMAPEYFHLNTIATCVVWALALMGSAAVNSLLVAHLAEPLEELALIAGRLAASDVSVETMPPVRGDEIGQLARALHRTSLNLRELSVAVRKVAGGDLRESIHVRSDGDALGKALAAVVDKCIKQHPAAGRK